VVRSGLSNGDGFLLLLECVSPSLFGCAYGGWLTLYLLLARCNDASSSTGLLDCSRDAHYSGGISLSFAQSPCITMPAYDTAHVIGNA